MKLTREFERDGDKVAVRAEHVAGDRWRVRVGDNVLEFDARALPDGGVRLASVAADGSIGKATVCYGAGSAQRYMVRTAGRTHTLTAPASRRGGGAGGSDGTVRAPMTGTVLDVLCQVGDTVTADQTLVVVSAMKMEHKLAAGIDGVVQSVSVQKNTTVDQGQALVVVEKAGEKAAAE